MNRFEGSRSAGTARFGRDRRVRKSQEFGAILKAGQRAATGLLSMAVVPTSGMGRIGISASTKVGGSVQRNRARRMVREYYRQIDTAPSYDVVVTLKPGFADLSSSQVRLALDEALSKAIASGKSRNRRPPLRN